MKKLFILTVISLLTAGTTFAIPILEAVRQNLIKITDVTGREEHRVTVYVRNLTAKNITVDIPKGTIIQPADSTEQTLVVIEDAVLALAKGDQNGAAVKALCCTASKRGPQLSSKFAVTNMAATKMIELLTKIAELDIHDISDIQSAVWAVSDQHRCESISHPDLRTYAAKLTNQTLQSFTLKYETAVIPGRIAFEPTGLHVDGNFKYYTDHDIVANLGLYTKEGKLISMMHQDLKHVRGQHNFHFKFRFKGLKPGAYVVKLTSGRKVISEMPVEF